MEITGGKDLICIERNDSEIQVTENEPCERQDLTTTNQQDTGDLSVACLSDKEDEKMTEASTGDSVVDQEFAVSDNVDACAYTESEETDLTGAKPEFGNETDFVHATMETYEEISQGNKSVVIQDDQETCTFSERTDNSLRHNNCDISICISPPVDDAIVTEASDDGHLNKHQYSGEDMSDKHPLRDSSFEVSASSETSVGKDNLEMNPEIENEAKEEEKSAVYIPLNLEKTEANNNVEVPCNEIKDFDKYAKTDFRVDSIAAHEEQCSSKPTEAETVISQNEFEERVENETTVAEIKENSDVSLEEKTAEIYENDAGTHIGDLSPENTDFRNADTLEMTTGQDLGTVVDTAVDSVQNEADILYNKEVQPEDQLLLENTIVLQRVDAGISNEKLCCNHASFV